MEQCLGRKLEPWELVHHKDGDKANNVIENLEVREFGEHTAEHHKGGRKSEDAKRTIEAFALMREQLKREREVKADLLEALERAVSLYGKGGGPWNVPSDPGGWLDQSRAAIAKARGEAA